ncbi:PHO85 cyclin-1 [Spathaspora sp. JA1]|nr:PHO85 cyclin-1 [Spathaspora sp. JA1]
MTSSLDLKALQIFVSGPVTQDMIHKLVVATLQVIPCKDTKSQTYTSTDKKIKPLPSLMTFLTKLVKYTNVYTGTLMATLVYLNKLKAKLPKNASGLPCTRHRILLSCLILSSKFHNDSSPKNKHWANYTDGLFTTQDINLMERQLTFLLNWDLKVTNSEMIEGLDSFLEPIRYDLIRSSKFKMYVQRQQQQAKAQAQAQAECYQATTSTSPVSVTPSHSRSSSTVSSIYHTRSSSTSSISSIVSTATSISTHDATTVDPIIELTALKEEMELKNLLNSLNSGSYAAQQMAYVYN